jgi:hypothetical protein
MLLPITALADQLTKKDKHFISTQLTVLKRSLKDVDSAKFRDVFLSKDPKGIIWVCGEVNSKNSYGAYAGFERFIGMTMVDGAENTWTMYCGNKISNYTVK